MSGVERAKLDRLDALLDERDLAAVWFARPASFAWLTGGDNVVDRASEVGAAAAGYDGDGVTVITNGIEAPRLRDEELPAEVAVETFEWYTSTLADAVAAHSPTPAAADFDVPGFEAVTPTLIRQPLTDADVERYRDLATKTAEKVQLVCRNLSADDSERQVAARLRGELVGEGIDAPVSLVGGSGRADRYRHYTPTDGRIGDYALVSVTASRDGLFTSCTRTVAFDPPDWLEERHAAATRVETTALANTQIEGREGGTAADVFAAIQDAYAATGYDGEWQHHHQGGAAGYAGREWIATPTLEESVEIPMAYAWNPTVRGAKSEDTVLVTDDDFEILTEVGDWPTRQVEAVGDDLTLERPDVLYL